ncbi:MAG: replication-associated recombination protein A [Archangiaceae bacterium]|nr:replication-associated recombination protein A [Archangiaceae bacterium]
MDLFEKAAEDDAGLRAPLAERMRPRTLAELVGQQHLTGDGHLLRAAIEADRVPSLIFWGPPGTGKTTLARVIAQSTGSHFHAVSAVLSGVKELREAVAEAEERWRMSRKRTILFVDEIHRFNKGQQDALLPHVEKGTITLLGATTENPSFEVNAALLSRMRVVTLKGLEEHELKELLQRALVDPRGLKGQQADDAALAFIAQSASGDARRALTALEVAAAHARGGRIDKQAAEEALQTKTLLYDKGGEEHYNVVSAFIKSMRASDPDAAVYWMARMLEAGEDPRFILRRMVIFASEDVGNAEPRGLLVAVAALQAFELMGLPEGTLPLTQAVTFLAMAPKSNTVITTYGNAREAIVKHGPLPVPMHLRNAPTRLMKSLGYGSGYQYPHDFEGHYAPGNHLPEGLRTEQFYFPSESGEEQQVKARYDELRARRAPSEPGEDG